MLMSSVMVFMVTLLVTYLNLGFVPDFLVQWVKAYVIAWPVAAGDRVHDHAGLPPPDRPHRRAPGAGGLMLSALDLARRIEAGELTPRAVVEMCAEAIAARESEIGAFTALDIEGARRTADSARVDAAARAAGRHEGHLRHRRFPDRLRLRRSMPVIGRRPTPRWSWRCAAPAA